MSGYSELLVKGEGRKEGKLYLNTIILSNLHPYIKIGTLFYLKAVEVGGSAKEKIFAEVGIPRNNGLRLIVVSNGMSLPACSRL